MCTTASNKQGRGGILDRRDVLDLVHGRSRMTIEGGEGNGRDLTPPPEPSFQPRSFVPVRKPDIML